jgi:DNA-binding PadR family transcriptional regulator
MGNLYRFVEPVLLYLLRQQGPSHGYDLHQQVAAHALTDAEIERAVLYRTLRNLESHGHVESVWNTEDAGPPRRVYRITSSGDAHLEEWAVVLEQLARSMSSFVRKARRGATKRFHVAVTPVATKRRIAT